MTKRLKDEVLPNHLGYSLFCLLILGLVLVGCGTATPESDAQVSPEPDAQFSPLAHVSPLATATPFPTETPVPQPTFTPTPMVTPAPLQLVVLHTNDNWGETEPCG